MKKLLIILITLMIAGCGSTPKDPKVELLEFRQAVQKAKIAYATVWDDMNIFVDINARNRDVDPLAAKAYGSNMIEQLQKALEDIKQIKYSPALKPARDAAVEREERNLLFNKKLIEVMTKKGNVEEIKTAKDDHAKAFDKYKEEIIKINGEFSPLPRLVKPMQPSECKTVTGNYGHKHIEGILKNNTGKSIGYAQILFTLYDKDGHQIGTAIDNINNLEKDATWKFQANALTLNGFYYAKLSKIDFR